ncbi:UNVERIFIED_ORG: hypothetical protein GGD51_004330 [Rhizobium esperanzae]|nr:hypothetical protein AMC89_PD00573 [Rhizobium phaseoli]ANM01740.1 hypothetical protein AMC79_PD00572 [Rhizobium phaseoli]
MTPVPRATIACGAVVSRPQTARLWRRSPAVDLTDGSAQNAIFGRRSLIGRCMLLAFPG